MRSTSDWSGCATILATLDGGGGVRLLALDRRLLMPDTARGALTDEFSLGVENVTMPPVRDCEVVEDAVNVAVTVVGEGPVVTN